MAEDVSTDVTKEAPEKHKIPSSPSKMRKLQRHLSHRFKEQWRMKDGWRLNPSEQERSLFARSNGLVSQRTLFAFRLLASMLWLAMTIWEIINWKHQGLVHLFFIYLTHWSTVLELFYFVLASYCSYRVLCQRSFHPYLLGVTWVIKNITYPLCIFVSLMYFGFVFKTGESVRVYLLHTADVVLVFLDACLTAGPLRVLHVWHPMLLHLVYIIFTVIYAATGGKSIYGQDYIYSPLNWLHTPYPAVGYAFAVVFINPPCSFAFMWLLTESSGFLARSRQERRTGNSTETSLENRPSGEAQLEKSALQDSDSGSSNLVSEMPERASRVQSRDSRPRNLSELSASAPPQPETDPPQNNPAPPTMHHSTTDLRFGIVQDLRQIGDSLVDLAVPEDSPQTMSSEAGLTAGLRQGPRSSSPQGAHGRRPHQHKANQLEAKAKPTSHSSSYHVFAHKLVWVEFQLVTGIQISENAISDPHDAHRFAKIRVQMGVFASSKFRTTIN
eukprot:g60653.t1